MKTVDLGTTEATIGTQAEYGTLFFHESFGEGELPDGRKVEVIRSVTGGTFECKVEGSDQLLRFDIMPLIQGAMGALQTETTKPAVELVA